ncbi:hypothetical protein ACVBEF_05860 [Glaciimonas sp. GG7]
MNDKNAKDASLVAQYKATAALLLAERKAKYKVSGQPDKARGGVVTIRFASNAQPLSAFGGVSKVLGPSRIQIPEYKLHRIK